MSNRGGIIHSLYEWCIENNRQDILDRWDNEITKLTPNEVGAHTKAVCYLKCERGLHESECFSSHALTHRANSKHPCSKCESFGQYCLDNNRQDWLDRWDYSKNPDTPFDIKRGSAKNRYFNCDKHPERESVKHMLVKIKDELRCPTCESFAYYGYENIDSDFLNKYWNNELNIGIDPWVISKCGDTQIFLRCQNKEYHGFYKTTCINFHKGVGCPYCNNKTIHPNDSFATYHINHTDVDFVSKYWSDKNEKSPFEYAPFANKKVWLKCQNKDYHPDFLIDCGNFTMGKGCPCCCNRIVHPLDSLGNKIPNCLEYWSDLNDKSPYEYSPNNDAKAWWKCENICHADYERSINGSVISDFRCPACVELNRESFLQGKVSKYITEKYGYTLLHERNCSIILHNPKIKSKRGQLLFDNEVYISDGCKLLIEVHGSQHYFVNFFHALQAKDKGTTPEQELHYQKVKDRYKKFMAYVKGYHYLEIPYTADDINESYKKLIDNKIASITK